MKSPPWNLESGNHGIESIDCIYLYHVWYLFGNRTVIWTQRHYGIIPPWNLEILDSWNFGPQNLGMESWNWINLFHFFTHVFFKLKVQRTTKTLWNQLLVFLESRNLGILEYRNLETELFHSIYLNHMWSELFNQIEISPEFWSFSGAFLGTFDKNKKALWYF